ncbi:hypothetical protein BDB01DRAFT_724164 [Pilobolus umbonatus]|nr:hypothetical protein BDB01DRAFT_724164 [Pilobolus umbonatus]
MSSTHDTITDNKNSLEEAEKFLESLNLPDSQINNNTEDTNKGTTDPNDIMSFLDEISKYPSEETEKKVESVVDTKDKHVQITEQISQEPTPSHTTAPVENSWMSWGNNFWSQASAAVKTTTDQINRTVVSDSASKLLESRVKTLQNLVNKENIEKLGTGLKNLTTTLLETVAPPISEHELVEVWLAYDMVGYSGLEALVYRAFARVMEHTESGQVVVRNPDNEDKKPVDPSFRDLNMCESFVDGTKLAKANIDYLIKKHYTVDNKSTSISPQGGSVPVIHCPVFMAIQPSKMAVSPIDDEDKESYQLSFIIIMVDPTHNLQFKSYSQSMPLSWLDIPYEENEWVEDKMVDMIRMAVTSIAQDYVWTRMSGATAGASVDDQVQEI